MVMNQLKAYFVARQELKQTTGILGDVLSVLHKEHMQGVSVSSDVTVLVTAMMDVSVQALLTLDRTSEIVVR